MPLTILFKKDRSWKRFVQFEILSQGDRPRDRSPNADGQRKAPTNHPKSGFKKIQDNLTSMHDTFTIHIPFQTVMNEIRLNHLVDGKLREYCSVNGSRTSQTDKKEIYDVPDNHLSGLLAILNEIVSTYKAAAISLDSAIVQLSTQFDIMLSDIVSEIIKTKPEILNSSERTIEYAELYAFDSLEDVKRHFSEKFVESLIRRSRSDQFSWFAQTLKIPMTKDLKSWPEFIEINERRNLLTHTDGVVSSAYIKNCSDAGFRVPNDVKVGSKLNSGLSYFERANSIFFEIGIKLIQVAWRKVIPSEIPSADQALIQTGFKLLSDNQLELALEILQFSNDVLKNVASDRDRRILLVNYANCQNLLDNSDEALKLLERFDWSASDLDFQTCVAAVRRDVDTVVSLMSKSVATGSLEEEAFRTWPVFLKIREDKRFKASYESLFGKELILGTLAPRIDLQGLQKFVMDMEAKPKISKEEIRKLIS